MCGIFVCLALVLVFVGTAGLCVGYAPAQLSLREGVPPALVRALQDAPDLGQVQAAQPASPSTHTGKPCASLEQMYDLAQNGDAEAQCWLARQYEDGLCGLCKDDPLAVVWIKKAAEAGRAEAQFALGIRYFFGIGVPQDLAQAVYWLHKAALRNHAEAQYRLAGCLEDGLGTSVDKAAGVFWYTRSAELGYPQAQNMLGILCIKGMGMPRDAQAAAAWFQKAAAQGYATAQFNLGCSYEKGEGVDKDREKALYWYGKAARQGDADAQARLEAF